MLMVSFMIYKTNSMIQGIYFSYENIHLLRCDHIKELYMSYIILQLAKIDIEQ